MAKIVTANMLGTGRVVFLSPDETWVTAVDAAQVFDDAEAAEAGLAIANRAALEAIVVDPFVVERGPEGDARPPMSLRDRIRAYGPTIKFLPADTKVA